MLARREIFRALKPGGSFASYEWALTEKYSEHNKAGSPAEAPRGHQWVQALA